MRISMSSRGYVCRSRAAIVSTSPSLLSSSRYDSMATDTRGGIGVRIVSVRASVIVILHGEDRRLQECVAGLHAQTRPPDEIIAVVSRETPRPALDDDDGPV